MNNRVLAIVIPVIIVVAIGLGFAIGNLSTKPVAVPGPTVTATATTTQTATVVAKPTVAANIALLRSAWAGMTPTDKATIREGWASARTTVSTKAAFVRGFGDSLRETLPTLTDAEIIEWLDWTLAN